MPDLSSGHSDISVKSQCQTLTFPLFGVNFSLIFKAYQTHDLPSFSVSGPRQKPLLIIFFGPILVIVSVGLMSLEMQNGECWELGEFTIAV